MPALLTLALTLAGAALGAAPATDAPPPDAPPPDAPPPDAVNAVLGDASAHALRPGVPLSETARIATHLTYVERILRAAPVGHLTPEQRQRRRAALDHLGRYRRRGVFPRNTYHPARRPVFVDADGRRCAVAALAEPALGAEVIEGIAARQRLAYIGEIDHPAVPRWAEAHGFTLPELAMIQPSYVADLRVETRRPDDAVAQPRDVVARARSRLAEDWRDCAGAAWSAYDALELPSMRATVTFYPVRGLLAGHVRLEPRGPVSTDAAHATAELVRCVQGQFSTRRFRGRGVVEAGRAYPIERPFEGGALVAGGRVDRAAADAVIAYTAQTQGSCHAGDGFTRWTARVTLDREGEVRAARVTARGGRAPAAVRRCLTETLRQQLGGLIRPGRRVKLTARFTLGTDPAQIELHPRHGSMGGETIGSAQTGFAADWAACLGARYPVDAGYVEHGVQPVIRFAPDGHRHRGILSFEHNEYAQQGPRTAELHALFDCVTARFARRRFHLDDAAPGVRYPFTVPIAFGERPVTREGGLAAAPLRLHLEHLARALAARCPHDPRYSQGWTVTVSAEPGGAAPGRAPAGGKLTAVKAQIMEGPPPDPRAEACLVEGLTAGIRLPPITRPSTVTIPRVPLLPAWADETLKPYPPPTIP